MVRPDRKVTIGGLVGSVVTIAVWIAHEIWAVDIPPGVEGAFVALLTFVVSYWVRNEYISEDRSGSVSRRAGASRVDEVYDGQAKGRER